jgi:curved DNA-binding protein CbpA
MSDTMEDFNKFYNILEVSTQATEEEIKKAFRGLSLV